MIRSRLLNVLVVAIGAVLFAFAMSYGLTAFESAQLYFRLGGGGDIGTVAIFDAFVCALLLSLAVWCIRGGVLNLRALNRAA